MPETIGQQLKAARVARNLTLEKVTQATHIQARLLEAMEADDFESLPSPVQGRAFLRLYAVFLELSLEDMIARQRQADGEQTPAILVRGKALGKPLVPGDISGDPETVDPVDEVQAGSPRAFLKKIKKILQPLRNRQLKPEETSLTGETTQLILPLVDPELVAKDPAKSGDEPAMESEPVAEQQPALLEEPVEGPGAGWQEEIFSTAGSYSDQPESQRIFTTIGQSLRQRRESLSLTLDEIEHHTHVRTHYLQALELGDFDHLPSSVQTRGMLNNYAHFLDMDLDAILLQFAEGLQAKRLERQPATNKESRNQDPKIPPRVNLPAGFRRYFSMDILVGGGLILILLAFAIWGTSRVINLRSVVTPQSTAQSISDILVGSSGTLTVTATPSLADTETIPPTEGVTAIGTIPTSGPGPVQVVVVALEQSYLRVMVDGKSQFDGRIMEGTAYSFSGNNQIEVLTGNGAGISILFNQGNLGPMGRYGEVVDRIYTAKAILNPTATNTSTPTISLTPTLTPRVSPTPDLTKTPLHSSPTP
jgi:cytoskeletal protein RodZ